VLVWGMPPRLGGHHPVGVGVMLMWPAFVVRKESWSAFEHDQDPMLP
jgi:hypothetical protein